MHGYGVLFVCWLLSILGVFGLAIAAIDQEATNYPVKAGLKTTASLQDWPA